MAVLELVVASLVGLAAFSAAPWTMALEDAPEQPERDPDDTDPDVDGCLD